MKKSMKKMTLAQIEELRKEYPYASEIEISSADDGQYIWWADDDVTEVAFFEDYRFETSPILAWAFVELDGKSVDFCHEGYED